jgi:hypothetical protein
MDHSSRSQGQEEWEGICRLKQCKPNASFGQHEKRPYGRQRKQRFREEGQRRSEAEQVKSRQAEARAAEEQWRREEEQRRREVAEGDV